jgi:hypothetical protein
LLLAVALLTLLLLPPLPLLLPPNAVAPLLLSLLPLPPAARCLLL